MNSVSRDYRNRMGGRFRSFVVKVEESDLWIGVDPESWQPAMEAFALERVRDYRRQLEAYGARRPEFLVSFSPIPGDPAAPEIAASMMEATRAADVGPMAAVAGAVALFVGRDLESRFGAREILVENGGDIWLSFRESIDISVLAGDSSLSGRIGVSLPPEFSPCGICTSSGTVGPSFSFGKADAAMIVCRDAALADAWATAIGNRVLTCDDIEVALAVARAQSLVLSAIIVKDDRMGIAGKLPLRMFAVD